MTGNQLSPRLEARKCQGLQQLLMMLMWTTALVLLVVLLVVLVLGLLVGLLVVLLVVLGLRLGLRPPLSLLSEPRCDCVLALRVPIHGELLVRRQSHPDYTSVCVCSKCWGELPRDIEPALLIPQFGCCCIEEQLFRLSAWTEADNNMQKAHKVVDGQTLQTSAQSWRSVACQCMKLAYRCMFCTTNDHELPPLWQSTLESG